MQMNNALVWIDLEMTGLDAVNDVILEAAVLITANDLSLIAQGPSIIIHQPEEKLAHMSTWVREQHTKSGLLDAVRASSITQQEAQAMLLEFVTQYTKPQTALLAGNSIWQDRFFLRMHMPELERYFHYRILDVSSIKEVVRRWYPQSPYISYKKSDTHRALEDIQESVNELQHYKKHFFIEV